jgi:hypothetical protein
MQIGDLSPFKLGRLPLSSDEARGQYNYYLIVRVPLGIGQVVHQSTEQSACCLLRTHSFRLA